jgi:hypothetical protein
VLSRIAADLDGAATGNAFVWATPPPPARAAAGHKGGEGEGEDEDAHLEEDSE